MAFFLIRTADKERTLRDADWKCNTHPTRREELDMKIRTVSLYWATLNMR